MHFKYFIIYSCFCEAPSSVQNQQGAKNLLLLGQGLWKLSAATGEKHVLLAEVQSLDSSEYKQM